MTHETNEIVRTFLLDQLIARKREYMRDHTHEEWIDHLAEAFGRSMDTPGREEDEGEQA